MKAIQGPKKYRDRGKQRMEQKEEQTEEQKEEQKEEKKEEQEEQEIEQKAKGLKREKRSLGDCAQIRVKNHRMN